MILLTRRPDMSREDFERYLRESHAPLVARLPGLRRLVVNVVQATPNEPHPEWDAIAEDWFDDAAGFEAALASAEGQAVVADAATFLDLNRFQVLVVQEEEIRL